MQSLHSLSLSLLLEHSGVFQDGAYTLVWYPDGCSCCLGTPLGSGDEQAHMCRSHRIVTNRKRVFKLLPPLGHGSSQEISLSEKEAY